MKILVDTNVLISAIVFDGLPEKLLTKLMSEHEVFITSYIEAELLEVIKEKWPRKYDILKYEFLHMEFPVYRSTDLRMGKIRDVKDAPILSDAIYYEADVILTGDKDFLESGYEKPRMLSVAELWTELYKK